MKNFLIMLLAFCLMTPAINAQNKELQKQQKKEYKKKMKEYKAEGWKLFGSTRSLDVALLTHYDKLNTLGDDAIEIVGIASKFQSKNVGKQMAINNACITYAQTAGSVVKGRIVSDLFGNGIDADTEIDKFYAAYERLVEKEIKGEMMESFSIIHEISNGLYEMQTYFIVSESAASKARIRAFENAAKESAAAQKYANEISEFVREGFKE